MINIVKDGDLFESNAEAWVNTVNCCGVMGKGIALGFKRRFHLYYNNYREKCFDKLLHPGSCYVFPQLVMSDAVGPDYIISFATKDKWWQPSQLKWIESGLIDLETILLDRQIQSIAVPALGCANGGLSWYDVKPLILRTCDKFPEVRFEIYEPK
jgi:O-acetyl-ADP-ribose deacetylase (regulator of RNase III)